MICISNIDKADFAGWACHVHGLQPVCRCRACACKGDESGEIHFSFISCPFPNLTAHMPQYY